MLYQSVVDMCWASEIVIEIKEVAVVQLKDILVLVCVWESLAGC